jgi:ElaB/YqjD/DUF883 family membrane-anchored ribosome-binding protein
MKGRTKSTHPSEIEAFADDAKALLAATADMAEEKVVHARERLTDALDQGKSTWRRAQRRALAGAKSVNRTVRSHPYQTLGIAVGIGALLGAIIHPRRS